MKHDVVIITCIIALSYVFGFRCATNESVNDMDKQATGGKATYDGIDVSHHQGVIDWKTVAKDTNIKFVYIKATEGKTYTDPRFSYNIKNARKYSLRVSVYHFLSCTSTIIDQFQHLKNIAPKNNMDLIPMLDIELDPAKCKWTKKQAQDSIRLFCELCEKYYGHPPILYGTQRSYNTWCAPQFNDCILYIGRYGENVPQITGGGGYNIWQYSETGQINGIDKPVDLCRFSETCSIKDILL